MEHDRTKRMPTADVLLDALRAKADLSEDDPDEYRAESPSPAFSRLVAKINQRLCSIT
jgi:hypothetical protein